MDPLSTKSERGFSLLEILVALAVTGLVVTAMTSVTGLLLRREAVQSQIYRQQESLMAIERLFRSLVSRAVPDVRQGAWGVRAMGTSSELRLLSLGPDSLMFDRPHLLTLQTDKLGAKSRLLIRWTDSNSGVSREEVISNDASGISFGYFNKKDGAARNWQADWTNPLVLPLAISLRLELPALGPPIDIVVRTRAALPNICRALPHEPYCRTEIDW